MLLRPSPSSFFTVARFCFLSPFLTVLFLLHAGSLHAQTTVVTLLQQVNHIAGTAAPGYSGDGAAAASATVNLPMGVAFDGGGNLYIADTGNNRVRRVDAVTGIITTVVGNGQQGYAGDGGAAANAQLDLPAGVAVDAMGNLFIADTGNNVVRKVNPQTGVITTVAGNGTAGYQGDLGPATAAELNHPAAIAVDKAENIFIADSVNNRVRRVDAGTGILTLYAGDGSATYNGDGMQATLAALNNPQGLAVDAAGDLYLTDTGYNLVREVVAATGNIQIVAGTAGQPGGFGGDGGLATSALLNAPTGLALDATGNLYISDSTNARIRKIVTGTITTYAGNGSAGFNSTDGNPAIQAQLNQPNGLAIDSTGELYVADTANNAVRAVSDGRHFPAVVLSSTQPISRNLYLQVNQPLSINSIVVSASEKQRSEFALSTQQVTVGTLTNCAATTYTFGSQCIVPLTFTPIYPGQRDASFSISTSVGTADIGLFGTGLGPETVLSPGIITSILPSLVPPTMGAPEQLGIDPQGNVYVADKLDNQILVWYAGNSTNKVYVGASPGAVVNATLNAPTAVALDAAGNLYIADSGANVILRVDAATLAITTVAGTGTASYSGDGGAATSATLNTPSGIAATADGTFYIADTGNNVVRRVDGQTGIITTAAGTAGPGGYTGDGGQAALATLNAPISVALDDLGNLYIADTGNNVIRMVNSVIGIITTVAGNGNAGFADGLATQALLYKPLAVAVDAADNLYIADAANARIRRVDASSGLMETIAGSNQQGGSGDGGGATMATLSAPSGVGVDALGQVVLADQTNDSVRSITAIPPAGLNFGTTVTGCGSTPPQTVELANVGNETLAVADLSAPIDFPLVTTNADKCVANVSQPAGSVCSMTFAFEPTAPGTLQEAASLSDNTQYIVPDSIQLVQMTGTGQPLNVVGTTTTVTAVPTSSAYGAPLVLTATVLTAQGPVITGTVLFSVNGVEVGGAALNGAGVASITIPAAPIGTALIVASHPQQCNYGPSAAQTSITVFQAATQTVLTASATNVPYGQPVTLEAIVTPVTSGVPTGLVDFIDGTAQIGQASLDGTGHATLVLNQKALPLGANTFTAQYLGDPDYLPSNSNSVVVDVYDAKLTMTVTPTLVQLAAGKSAQLHVTLTPLNGFDQTVYLSCAGLTAGAECIFKPATVPFNTLTTTQQVTLTIQSNILVTAGVRSAADGKSLFGWLLMFFTLLAAYILQRTRRIAAVAMYRWVVIAIVGIGLATGFGTLTGCGSTAPLPGIYTTVMVQASTPSNGVLVSTPIQLDMGQ
ncbi:MAG: NHL domain-containing protein [Acidobacteriaceae bacterium]